MSDITFSAAIAFSLLITAPVFAGVKTVNPIDQKVNVLLAKMTLANKVGQLNQYICDNDKTGPVSRSGGKLQNIEQSKVGSMFNVLDAKDTRYLQKATMRSRLKIPLIFGQDVIHGYRVTFPVPLAEAASWDMNAIGLSARVAATEAAAAGTHWIFAPTVDIGRDPRRRRIKLPVSFQREMEHIPVYYAYKNTGRPLMNDHDLIYKSA